MLVAALALLLAAQVPASSPTRAAPPRDQSACINEDGSTTWTPVDAHTLVVSSGGQRFKVTTATCPALTRALPTVNVVLPGGGYICGPHDAHLYVSSAGGVGPLPCPMESLTPIIPAQAAALTPHR
ncbi:MAG: hypothetical protein INR64_02080 [Caulobacteraceae bacterium]|nr:hypothetical protein [Caulobacter sp.]